MAGKNSAVDVDLLKSIRFMHICKDKRLWDRKLEETPSAWLSHTSQWQDCVEASFPHIQGFPLLMEGEGRDTALLPLYRVASLIKGTRYVSVPFSSLSNVLINSEDDIPAFVDYFHKLQGQHKRRVSFELRSNRVEPLLEKSGFFYSSRNYFHHFLDLQRDIGTIFGAFHETGVKQTIKKSEKSGLVLRKADQPSQVDDFYRLYCLTRKRLGMPPMPIAFFKNLFSSFFPRGALDVYFAEYGGEITAGLWLFKYRDMVCVEFAGDDFIHRKLYPNHFLYWHGIRTARQEGYRIFSFGRTFHLNGGLLQFKRRWGTKEEQMVDYFFPPQGSQEPSKENSSVYRFIRFLSPRLPMPLLKMMGKIIYRHLG